MPFTLAHPALVLPFTYIPRKWISMTALVIGSIMPDAEAFIRMYSEKSLTHSWPGFFLFGIPFGIAVSFIFHNIVRDPLINHLPRFLHRRFSKFVSFNWNKRFATHWPVILMSLIIGGASHFLWDSFSHFDGWFINTIPGLKGNVYLFGGQLEIPFLIQYINTVIGVMIIVFYVAFFAHVKSKSPTGNAVKFWVSVVITGAVIFAARFMYFRNNTWDDLLIGIISSCLFALTMVAFAFSKSRPQSRPV